MARQHLFLHVKRAGDIDIVLRHKIDSSHGVKKVDFRNRGGGWGFGLNVRNGGHDTHVAYNLCDRAMVRMIVVWGMGQNHVGTGLANDVEEIETRLLRGEEKSIAVVVHRQEFRSKNCRGSPRFFSTNGCDLLFGQRR